MVGEVAIATISPNPCAGKREGPEVRVQLPVIPAPPRDERPLRIIKTMTDCVPCKGSGQRLNLDHYAHCVHCKGQGKVEVATWDPLNLQNEVLAT
jgi:hypothetical protein